MKTLNASDQKTLEVILNRISENLSEEEIEQDYGIPYGDFYLLTQNLKDEKTDIADRKQLVKNCIRLMGNLMDFFAEYLDYMDIHPECEEEKFGVSYSSFKIVQRLLLEGTRHSGGTSTRALCSELGFDEDIIFAIEYPEE